MRQRVVMGLAALAALSISHSAMAAGCASNPDAIGTSRVMLLDTSKGMALGEQYHHDLPLADKEVVLTFDDGPLPIFSEKVRAILQEQCVRATFFLVGRNAAAYPEFVRKLADEGHTIGSHTFTHNMNLPSDAFDGNGEIDKGIAAIDKALKTSKTQNKTAPFFRFPGLTDKPEVRVKMEAKGMAVFSIDAEGGDWKRDYTSKDVLNRVMKQLGEKRKGIVLLHDIQPRTVKMLPEFLARLKSEGYKIVHVVPASMPQPDTLTIAATTTTDLVAATHFGRSAHTGHLDIASATPVAAKQPSKTVAEVKAAPEDEIDTAMAEAKARFAKEDEQTAPAVLAQADAKPEADPVLAAAQVKTADAETPQTHVAKRPKLVHRDQRSRTVSLRRHDDSDDSNDLAPRSVLNRKPAGQYIVASPSYIQHRRPASSEYLLNSIFNSFRVN